MIDRKIAFQLGAPNQNNFNFVIMEELQNLIKERFDRVSEVSQGNMTPDRFRILKEEEKGRCEKENFVISMMRANKATQVISKNLYFNVSYHIMREINPNFKHELNTDKLDENFLNDFVGLYRHFFSKYEETLNFKVKLQNLIRPTNHNLIIDLVRYLVDFSRDYYQQTFFWSMKPQKIQKIEEEESKDLEEKSKEESEPILKKKIGRASLNQMILQRQNSKKEREVIEEKRDPQKNYTEVLDILGLHPLSNQPKDGSINVEALKFKINQIYRDMKSRNQFTKNNITGYYSRFIGENDQKQKQYLEDEESSINQAIFPFKMTLNIEKSGFNYISVFYSDAKTFIKSKDKRLSPLKVSQRLMPAFEKPQKQYMLTSLKVLRISDNFLPPLTNQNLSLPATPSKDQLKDFHYNENTSRFNLMSSSSAANEQEIERKKKKFSYEAQGSTQYLPEGILAKEKSIRKLNQLKRNFKSEEKREGGILLNSNSINTSNPSDPEKKIFDWLEKLRLVKEIERKKIMGL